MKTILKIGFVFLILMPHLSLAQTKTLSAQFSYDTTKVCEGIISFTDESTGGPTSWHWEFGDGASTSAQHPTHEYDRLDTFKVTLVVRNASDSDTIVQYIALRKQPIIIDFLADSQLFCAPPAKVSFTNHTQNAVDFLWIFGDGDTSSQVNPQHTYLKDSIINVTLMAHSKFCGIDQKTIPRFIVFDTTLSANTIMPDNGTAIKHCPQGILYDNGGATGDYLPNTFSQMILTPPQTDYIRLVVEEADMATGDSICIYSDTSAEKILLASFSSLSDLSNDTLFSTDSIVSIVFHSDASSQRSGFKIQWKRQQYTPQADFYYTVREDSVTKVQFHNTSQHMDSCLWIFDDSIFSSQVNPSYTFPELGAHTATLIVYHYAQTDTMQQTIVLNRLVSQWATSPRWHVFPNPVQNKAINIAGTTVEKIELYDMQGCLVFIKTEPNKNKINISNLSKGFYNLIIFGKEKIQIEKIIIQ